MARKKREATEVNAGSMADIAFLLLIFFLVTTTIASDKGIAVMLPPKQDEDREIEFNERNLYNIQINSRDEFLIEDERGSLSQIREGVKRFVLNYGKDPKSSESPQKGVVSLKTDRGTSYEMYVKTYDQLKLAYSELRAQYLGIPLDRYNALDKDIPEEKDMLKRAADEFPFRVSDAEPTDLSKLQ